MPSLAQALVSTPSITFSKLSEISPSTVQQGAPDSGSRGAQESLQPRILSPVKIQSPAVIANGLGLTTSYNQPISTMNPAYAELDNNEPLQSHAGMTSVLNLQAHELAAAVPQITTIPLPSRAAPLPPNNISGGDYSTLEVHQNPQLLSTYAPYSAAVLGSIAPSWTQPTLRAVPSASTNISTQSSDTLKNSTPASSSHPITPTSSATLETNSQDWDDNWNDAALLKYLDKRGHNDAKDLLLLVHDRHNVAPVGHDHPIMMTLGYQQKQQQLNTMQGQLDRLLNDWVSKKAQRKGRLGHETGIRLARAEAFKKRLG